MLVVELILRYHNKLDFPIHRYYNRFVSRKQQQTTFNCIVTGEAKYMPPGMLKKKISKFGSEDEFAKHYVSMPARKLLKSGLSVAEVREQLNVTSDLPDVDLKILLRLKLVKLNKRKGNKEQEEAAERRRYLNSKEFKDKMIQIKLKRESMTFEEEVIEMTGGPDGCQRVLGGTCVRPDIFLTHNHKACDGCEYYEFCVCDNKRLSHEKKRRKRK